MLDPREEILSFGRDEHEVVRLFLHPLSDTASAHYRYLAGDTLTISFVGDEAPVRLEEVRVRPRRADARLVAASLWFDLETGQMVRASMRPTRPMTLGMGVDTEEGSLTARSESPPGPLQFEVQYITIDYLLQDREWWVARRFAFGGEVRVGRWARLPFLIETTVNDYSVNPVEPGLTRDAAEADGWLSESSIGTASEESGAEPDTLITMVPPLDSLVTTGLLPDPGTLQAGPAIDPGAEFTEIRRGLEGIITDVAVSHRPRFGLGAGSWRFNRVEGLSAGAAMTVPVTARVNATLMGRIGVADWQPRGEATGRAGRTDESSVHLAAYRRLADGSDFDDPLDLSSSVKALFTGNDRGQFYDAYGAELGLGWTRPGREGDLRVFVEEHRAVEAETSFHLLKPFTKASVAANIGAEEGRLQGIAATFRWSWGTDPAGLSAWGALAGEAATGAFEYQRASVTLGTSLPTVAHIAGALEVSAGTSWNGPPVQRRFYLGGGNTLRGFHESELAGEAFWYGRAELATGSPALPPGGLRGRGVGRPEGRIRLRRPLGGRRAGCVSPGRRRASGSRAGGTPRRSLAGVPLSRRSPLSTSPVGRGRHVVPGGRHHLHNHPDARQAPLVGKYMQPPGQCRGPRWPARTYGPSPSALSRQAVRMLAHGIARTSDNADRSCSLDRPVPNSSRDGLDAPLLVNEIHEDRARHVPPPVRCVVLEDHVQPDLGAGGQVVGILPQQLTYRPTGRTAVPRRHSLVDQSVCRLHAG